LNKKDKKHKKGQKTPVNYEEREGYGVDEKGNKYRYNESEKKFTDKKTGQPVVERDSSKVEWSKKGQKSGVKVHEEYTEKNGEKVGRVKWDKFGVDKNGKPFNKRGSKTIHGKPSKHSSSGSKSHSRGSKSHSRGSKSHSRGSKSHSRGSKSHSRGSKSHSRGSRSHSRRSNSNVGGEAFNNEEGEYKDAEFNTMNASTVESSNVLYYILGASGALVLMIIACVFL